MNIRMQAIFVAIFVAFILMLGAKPGSAQDFSAAFAAELRFQPAPFSLNTTLFDLLLAASVSDTRFVSHTQFDLSGLRSQQFTIDLLIGALTASDRLLFKPSLDFERNSLALYIRMLGFNLALETILEELGPPSPDINPGLVIEAGGRSSLGVGITSFTGFGVTQIVEDVQTTFACLSLELRCLGDDFPDDEFDRQVVKPFLFSEQAVQVDFTIKPVKLLLTPVFTLSGFDRLLLEANFILSNPLVRFSSISTLDTSGLIQLTRQQILFEIEVGSVGWRALTILAGSPITFESQTVKLRVSALGFNLYTTVIFNMSGLNELRFGAGLAF